VYEKMDYLVLLAIAIDVLPIAFDELLPIAFDALPIFIDELLPILVLPCANTGAAIPTINDTAAMIVTIAIKFNLDMQV
jgi:hypothetical protein